VFANIVFIVSRSSLDSYQELFNLDNLSQVLKFNVLDCLLSNELVTFSLNNLRINYTISELNSNNNEKHQLKKNEVEDDLPPLYPLKIELS